MKHCRDYHNTWVSERYDSVKLYCKSCGKEVTICNNGKRLPIDKKLDKRLWSLWKQSIKNNFQKMVVNY